MKQIKQAVEQSLGAAAARKKHPGFAETKKLRAYKFPVSVGVSHYASRTFFLSNLNTAAPLHRRSYSSFVYLYISIYLPVLSLWAFEVCIVFFLMQQQQQQ